jgi:hypothetical protein
MLIDNGVLAGDNMDFEGKTFTVYVPGTTDVGTDTVNEYADEASTGSETDPPLPFKVTYGACPL